MTTEELLEELKGRLCREAPAKMLLTTPELLASYVMPLIGHEEQEHLLAIALDIKLGIISHKIISIGTVDRTLIAPKDIFRFALLQGASWIAIAHNHPSGCVKPSDEDFDATKLLIRAGAFLEIQVADHLVVSSRSGKPCFTSIRQTGRIQWQSLYDYPDE